jgi:hypothetical protein
MMMEAYSKDIPLNHFSSLAPWLVGTQMQQYLCNKVDVYEFPETNKFIESREDRTTRSSEDVAKDIIQLIPKLQEIESGSYIDLRSTR